MNAHTKKMIIWTVVIVVLGVAIFLSALKFGNDTDEQIHTVVSRGGGGISPADTDTDSDGLPDWKEELLGLDPKKGDTDGDGVSDGEEADAMLAKNDFVPAGQAEQKSSLPFAVFPQIDKNIIPTSETQTVSDSVRISKISPSEGVYGTEIIITGEGFSALNTLYTGYGVFRDIESFDGKTIRFIVEPDFAANSRGTTTGVSSEGVADRPNFGVLPFWFFVENENGISNGSMFRFYVR